MQKRGGLSSFSALYPRKHTAGKPTDFLTQYHCSFTKTSSETPRIIWEYCILIFLNNSYPALKQNLSFKNYSTLFYNNISLLAQAAEIWEGEGNLRGSSPRGGWSLHLSPATDLVGVWFSASESNTALKCFWQPLLKLDHQLPSIYM